MLGLSPEAWIAIAGAVIALASLVVAYASFKIARGASQAQAFALMVEMIDRHDNTAGMYDLDPDADDYDERLALTFATTMGLLNALSAGALHYDGLRYYFFGGHNFVFLYLADAITERYTILTKFPDFEGLVTKTQTRPDPYRFLIEIRERHGDAFKNVDVELLNRPATPL